MRQVSGDGRALAILRSPFAGSRGLLAVCVALSILQSALLIPVAVLVRHVFDTQLPHRDAGAVALTGACILLRYLTSAGLGLVTRYNVLKATKKAITALRVRLLERLYELPRVYFDHR